ncbi:glycosyltransferase [Pseudarthrobacter oxydans]|uniref:glycosyltransferase n=1 Tax=Pseudarthrobacter oxydans TaxID=1671 RepID=UPI0038250498
MLKVLRVVNLASATGKYGGPFDTSVSQARLIAKRASTFVTLVAGALPNDAPAWGSQPFTYQFPTVRKLPRGRGFTSCMSWTLLRCLVRTIRASDIIHVSYARELTPLLAAQLAIIFRKPLVLQPHGMLTARTSRLHRVVDLIARPIFLRASRIVALTVVERSELQNWSGLRNDDLYIVIGNPLPFERKEYPVLTIKPGARALFIARLEPRKRVSDFLDAQRYAATRGWDEVYEIVGPDQGDGEAVRLAAAATDKLVYRGAVPATEIDNILDTAGVFVLTSRNEPWGNVLVAALVKGIPVVVTESAALAQEIRQNHLGLVVPDASPEMVAEAVHVVLTEQWRSTEQEEAAREFCRMRFDQRAIGNQLFNAYSSALGSGGMNVERP